MTVNSVQVREASSTSASQMFPQLQEKQQNSKWTTFNSDLYFNEHFKYHLYIFQQHLIGTIRL